jgi:hypothetical protein
LRTSAETLTTALDDARWMDAARLATVSTTLLGLSHLQLSARPALAQDLQRLVERLVREVGDTAVGLDGDTANTVLAAAALATAGGERSASRARELLRRADPDVVSVGDDLWLAVEGDAAHATLAHATADLALGDRSRAFALLATVARWRARGRALASEDLALARAIALALAGTTPIETAHLDVDGTGSEVALLAGRDQMDLPILATTGTHHVGIDVGDRVAVHAIAYARYGVPWETPPERPGPFVLTLVGETRGQDEISGLELIVANHSPRWIARPVVEIAMPTGAEITAAALVRVRASGRRVNLSESLLTVGLEPIAPGAERRIVLPIRWSIAGTLAGIGASAYATDRLDAVSVLVPAPLEIAPLAGGAP